MINEETIVSVYNDKMTLLQFLKTVNKALDEAVLTSVEISKKGNATLSFVFVFADGTKIESGEIVLQQGESITDAKIVDGHLYLTLSNDERLDAGNVKPVTRFEINASQHLIVYYGDGTSQDLGVLSNFSNADFVAKTVKQTNFNYEKEFTLKASSNFGIQNIYNRFVEINNILYIITNFVLTNTSTEDQIIGNGYSFIGFTSLTLKNDIASKIFDIEGNSIANANVTNDVLIASEPALLTFEKVLNSNTKYKNAILSLTNREGENSCAVQVALNGNVEDRITLHPNEKIYVTARISLTLR